MATAGATIRGPSPIGVVLDNTSRELQRATEISKLQKSESLGRSPNEHLFRHWLQNPLWTVTQSPGYRKGCRFANVKTMWSVAMMLMFYVEALPGANIIPFLGALTHIDVDVGLNPRNYSKKERGNLWHSLEKTCMMCRVYDPRFPAPPEGCLSQNRGPASDGTQIKLLHLAC